MTYQLGKRSKDRLLGVDPRMVAVVEKAITISEQDFSVICGLRTVQEQEALVAKGASQTMKSKHLEGLAVDLMAYIDGGRWELTCTMRLLMLSVRLLSNLGLMFAGGLLGTRPLTNGMERQKTL